MKDAVGYEPCGPAACMTIDRPAAPDALNAEARPGRWDAVRRFHSDDDAKVVRTGSFLKKRSPRWKGR